MRVPRRLPLLLLLLAVTAGLFTMHTFGHSGPATGLAHAPHAAAMAGMQDAGIVAATEPMTVLVPGGPAQMPMDPMAVCLAVLCVSALIVAALTALRRAPTRAHMPAHLTAGFPASGRGPPTLRIGLQLADLSVLRN